MDNYYFDKYLKYKNKYLELKRYQIGGLDLNYFHNLDLIINEKKNFSISDNDDFFVRTIEKTSSFIQTNKNKINKIKKKMNHIINKQFNNMNDCCKLLNINNDCKKDACTELGKIFDSIFDLILNNFFIIPPKMGNDDKKLESNETDHQFIKNIIDNNNNINYSSEYEKYFNKNGILLIILYRKLYDEINNSHTNENNIFRILLQIYGIFNFIIYDPKTYEQRSNIKIPPQFQNNKLKESINMEYLKEKYFPNNEKSGGGKGNIFLGYIFLGGFIGCVATTGPVWPVCIILLILAAWIVG